MGKSSLGSSYERVMNTNGLGYPSEKAVPKLLVQPGVCVESALYLWFYASVFRRALSWKPLRLAGLTRLWVSTNLAGFLWPATLQNSPSTNSTCCDKTQSRDTHSSS